MILEVTIRAAMGSPIWGEAPAEGHSRGHQGENRWEFGNWATNPNPRWSCFSCYLRCGKFNHWDIPKRGCRVRFQELKRDRERERERESYGSHSCNRSNQASTGCWCYLPQLACGMVGTVSFGPVWCLVSICFNCFSHCITWSLVRTGGDTRWSTGRGHESLVQLVEGSLEVKLPTIWTVEKQRWEESEEKRSEERRCRCAKR